MNVSPTLSAASLMTAPLSPIEGAMQVGSTIYPIPSVIALAIQRAVR